MAKGIWRVDSLTDFRRVRLSQSFFMRGPRWCAIGNWTANEQGDAGLIRGIRDADGRMGAAKVCIGVAWFADGLQPGRGGRDLARCARVQPRFVSQPRASRWP